MPEKTKGKTQTQVERKVKYDVKKETPFYLQTLDVFINHFVYGRELTEHQKKSMNRFYWVQQLSFEGYSNHQLVEKIRDGCDSLEMEAMSESNARLVVRKAKALFGDTHIINKKFEKHAKIEYLQRCIKKLEAWVDDPKNSRDMVSVYELILKYQKEVAQLEGLYGVDANTVDPTLWMEPGIIIYTSDPSKITDQNQITDAEIIE